jgi:hypothetical protein
MVSRLSTLVTNQPGTSTTRVTGTEIINAIANLALAARAGTLLRTYQREWEWMDKQNNVDPVDADVFNDTFHGIEREFDKLVEILAQTGGLPPPDRVLDATLLASKTATAAGQPVTGVLIEHDLNSMDLLVDLKLMLPQAIINELVNQLKLPTGKIDPNGAGGWTDYLSGQLYAYVIPDPNNIILFRTDTLTSSATFATAANVVATAAAAFQATDLTVRAFIWKL